MILGTFKRGIHPPDTKYLTKEKPVSSIPVPDQVIIPLSQHVGTPCNVSVSKGQIVKLGDCIGTSSGFVSVPVHASVSGTVTEITEIGLPNGRTTSAVVIQNDHKDTWCELKTADYLSLSPDEIRTKIHDAGIAGMGGAAFPSHVKLSPGKEKPIDSVIINGVECEPYITSDYRLMIERPDDVIKGLRIIMRILGNPRGYIAIERNKPKAIKAVKAAIAGDSSIQVCELKVKYPQGAEKMVIKAILNREVPIRKLPADAGAVVHNVATATAIYEAVCIGKPLVERIVCVTGEAVKEPNNFLVRIGTSVSDLLKACGGTITGDIRILNGGPMMGFAMTTTDVPVTKGTSAILVIPAQSGKRSMPGPCIRCGRCIRVCPMGLLPSMLGILSEKGMYEEMKEYNLFDCFECGSCTYACPSKRPLVQLIRLAKSIEKP